MTHAATEIAATLINPGCARAIMRRPGDADRVRDAEAKYGPEAAAHLCAAIHHASQAALYRWVTPPGVDRSHIDHYTEKADHHRARFAALAQEI